MNQPSHLMIGAVKELTNPGAAFKFNYLCRNFRLRTNVSLASPMSTTAFPTGVTATEAADIGKHISKMVTNFGLRWPALCSVLVASAEEEEDDMVLDWSSGSGAQSVTGLKFNWAKSTDPDPVSAAMLVALRKKLLLGANKTKGRAEKAPSGAVVRPASTLPPPAPKKRVKAGGAKAPGSPVRGIAAKAVRGMHTPAVSLVMSDVRAAAAERILEVNAEATAMQPYYTVRTVAPHDVWADGGVVVIVQFPFTLLSDGPKPGWILTTKKLITRDGAGGTYVTSVKLYAGGSTQPHVQSGAPPSSDIFSSLPGSRSSPSAGPGTAAYSDTAFGLSSPTDRHSVDVAAANAAPAAEATAGRAAALTSAPVVVANPMPATADAITPDVTASELAGASSSSPDNATHRPPATGSTTPRAADAAAPASPTASQFPLVNGPSAAATEVTLAAAAANDSIVPSSVVGSNSSSPADRAGAGSTVDHGRPPPPAIEAALVFPPPRPSTPRCVPSAMHDAILRIMGLTNDDLGFQPNDTMTMTTIKSAPPPPVLVEIVFQCNKELDLTRNGERKGQHGDFLIATYAAHPEEVEKPMVVVID